MDGRDLRMTSQVFNKFVSGHDDIPANGDYGGKIPLHFQRTEQAIARHVPHYDTCEKCLYWIASLGCCHSFRREQPVAGKACPEFRPTFRAQSPSSTVALVTRSAYG